MACGCSSVAGPNLAMSERAMMCGACPERSGVTACTISGRPLVQHITEGVCPLGSFPGPGRQTEWIGVKWWGVPAPIRWAARTRLGRAILGGIPKPAPHPGCGCLVRLKALWTRLRTP